MIGRLKKKFVLINMSIILVVLSLMLVWVLSTAAQQFKESYQSALQTELSFTKPGNRHFGRETEKSSDRLSFTVIQEPDMKWRLLTPWIEIEEEKLHGLIERANRESAEQGFWPDEGIAYQKKGVKIAYVNLESEYKRYTANRTTWIIVYVVALILFLIISIFFANWTVAPVKKAWQNQKAFVSDASHELKTPLTVILANLEIAMQNGGDSKWISVAKGEADYMKKLIDNLLFLARSDERMQLKIQKRIDLSALVQELTLAFEAIAFEKQLHLESDIADQIFVNGDVDLLRQLLSILLENAVKYTQKNNRIYVALSVKQDRVKLCVQNSGSYVSQEKLEHLFERFYRVDEARTKGGYGLGLSIAQKIVLLHGGEIKAASNEAEGTSFTVRLSRAE